MAERPAPPAPRRAAPAATGTPAIDASCMDEALVAARHALAAGGPPIGACLVESGEVLVRAANAVAAGPDPTAHAEIVAIREACRQRRTARLDGCTLYVTVEPCPMCRAACHYAGIARIVWGAPITALHAVTGSELVGASSPAGGEGGVRGEACLALLDEWARLREATA